MLNKFMTSAKLGEPVYISDVDKAFHQLEHDQKLTIHLQLDMLEENQVRFYEVAVPKLNLIDEDALLFIKSYLQAEIYNILSSVGGKKMTFYMNQENQMIQRITEDLNDIFCVTLPRNQRRGYGLCLNVIDRMLETLNPTGESFSFVYKDLSQLPEVRESSVGSTTNTAIFKQVTQNLEDKIICGIDVGGTDIKVVAVKNGVIDCYKEYDWFPAKFTQSSQLIDPIIMIVQLIRLKLSLDRCENCTTCDRKCDESVLLKQRILTALEKEASDAFILDTIARVEGFLDHIHIDIDAIGLCFPDVVVKNKVVGGEVYKTRGIRNNPNIDYELDFKTITNLNNALQECIKNDGVVEICNDGPMASFTAAAELAAMGDMTSINHGVFAHTLGTELGTGWVQADGCIPDIPLEVYNYIIDLGSYPEKAYSSDDLRSINNFNTELAGTLQKYCSQSGVFRLAMKYFPSERPDLYQELFDLGYVKVAEENGHKQLIVPTEPSDMRKPFLEHMMALPEREKDEVNNRIWREIGEFLAITYLETEKILKPEAKSRYLFGRLVKRQRCFDLMLEGARSIVPDIELEVANADMAVTDLMKQLELDPRYTVAQFAQAIGAVYYANR